MVCKNFVVVIQLKTIEYIDVAEESLKVLEVLSHQHHREIRTNGGIDACIEFIDFHSIHSQQNALAICASCAQDVTQADFAHVRENLSKMTSLLRHEDRKCLEHVCTFFSRLVMSFARDSTRLGEIASHGLMTAVQQLVSQPTHSPIFPLMVNFI